MLIKGMEMPKNCIECRFRQYEYCDLQRQDVYAVNIMDYALSLERHPSCPLIEIPTPHGDLVDRDAMIAEYDRQHKGPVGGARQIMVDAKAVIEAEGKGK